VLEFVESANRHRRVAGSRGVNIEPVPGPSQPHLLNVGDASNRTHRFFRLCDQAGVNTIQ
jgi:hypothetical protein